MIVKNQLLKMIRPNLSELIRDISKDNVGSHFYKLAVVVVLKHANQNTKLCFVAVAR